jgi:hypothetical protein
MVSDGQIRDSAGKAVGSIRPDGSIRDSLGQTVGFIRPDGSLRDRYGNGIGTLRPDGSIRDSYGQTLATIRSDGTVRDRYGSGVGSVPPEAQQYARPGHVPPPRALAQRAAQEKSTAKENLERSIEENRRRLRDLLPEAPAGLDRAVREKVSEMVALQLSHEAGNSDLLNKTEALVDGLSDGLFRGQVPGECGRAWPAQCQRAREEVDNARFYCLEGEALRCFCTILAGDILLGGDGAGSRLDPKRHLGELYPLDWL